MANMSYCRFQNTLKDLKDCYEHIEDDNLSAPESLAQNRLITLCRQIAALFDDEANDSFEEMEERIAELESDNAAYKKIIADWQISLDQPENQIQVEQHTAQHTESIVCPNCNHIEQATVLHTAPFYSYVHICAACKYTIIESEWQRTDDYVKEYSEGGKL